MFYSYQNLVKVSTQGQGHIQGHPMSFSTKIYTFLQTTGDDDINQSYESTLIGVSNVNTNSRQIKVTLKVISENHSESHSRTFQGQT